MKGVDWSAYGWGFGGAATGAAVVILIRGGLWDPIAASWAQALGTVVAVLGAIWIAQANDRKANGQREERRNLLLKAANVIASGAGNSIGRCVSAANMPAFYNSKDDLLSAEAALIRSEVAITTFPRYELGVIEVSQLLDLIAGEISAAKLLIRQLVTETLDVYARDSIVEQLERHASCARETWLVIARLGD